MSNLENLTAKILADAQARSQEILAQAKANADQVIGQQEALANQERDRIIADAETEALRTEERIVLGKTLAIRDENLGSKQEMLDKVFTLALEQLNAMPQKDYWSFVCGYLAALDTDGETIFFPARYNITSIDELNSFLRQKGKKGNLVLGSSAARAIDGGFILAKNGIEQNNTFTALVNYYRYELESQVLSTLY